MAGRVHDVSMQYPNTKLVLSPPKVMAFQPLATSSSVMIQLVYMHI